LPQNKITLKSVPLHNECGGVVMAKMSMKTRKEIIETHRAKYERSTKKGKGSILDAVCMATGLSRSRAQKLLSQGVNLQKKSSRSGRNRKYGQKVREALEFLWPMMDYASGKRLCAGMEDFLDALVRFDECPFDDKTVALLKEMSPATADRLLVRARKRVRIRGISTTKPGTLLKQNIPIRLGSEWDEGMPGFVEIDLVAHCGSTASGEYVNTLDVIDICSGWTETGAVINKAQKHVFAMIKHIRGRLPFPLLGIDSDNGSEFINGELYTYCKEENIMFTRSRPYKKNDGCHIEQKNWHIVRRNIGYGRYEGSEAVRIMNEYYSLLRLHTNFFMPHMKLASKVRDGARVKKRYDRPMTPYKRLLEDDNISEDAKAQLTKTFLSLNPAVLKRDMAKLLDTLMGLTLPT
jgi:hypothetical protein